MSALDNIRKGLSSSGSTLIVGILIVGLVATFGYNYIPFKAYVIVAALAGLFTAMILTIKNKKA